MDEAKYDVALKRFKEAAKIAEELKDNRKKAEYLNNLTLVQLNQKNYTDAWKTCNEALSLFKELDDKMGLADTNYKMGLIYLDQKSYAEAMNRHEEALEILGSSGFRKHPLNKVLKSNIKLIKNNLK